MGTDILSVYSLVTRMTTANTITAINALSSTAWIGGSPNIASGCKNDFCNEYVLALFKTR